MQRTKAWLLLVFGLDGDQPRRVQTEAREHSLYDRSTVCPLVPILALLIRLTMALALVLELCLQVFKIL
jgi:hypothetical protein